jgi:type II secretory pathway component HofQ
MPGHVQNPDGRPRKVRTIGATIAGALKEAIPVTENGRRRNISKLQAAAQQIANKSAAGDLRASKMAIDLAQRAEQQAAEQSPIDRLSASDEEIVERVKARLRRIIIEEMEQEDGHPDTSGV